MIYRSSRTGQWVTSCTNARLLALFQVRNFFPMKWLVGHAVAAAVGIKQGVQYSFPVLKQTPLSLGMECQVSLRVFSWNQ